MIENIWTGFLGLLTVGNFVFILLGMMIGIIFGALPGLTATMAVALFTPITFGMEAETGILMLLAMYCGATYGGSITAILLKTPGTPASAATALDGYALTQKGHAGKALEMALYASTIGGLASAAILLLVAPQLARLATAFGPPEFFALALFGLTIIGSMSGDNILKGLIMGALGMLVSCIGIDKITGVPRMTFGHAYLAGVLQLIPVLIGLFAIAELLRKIEHRDFRVEKLEEFSSKDRLERSEKRGSMRTILKSSVIGTVIGAIPGTGAAIASFLSYSEAKRSSKAPQEFGRGSVEGIAASEAGNNGVTGATLIPLLTLGIPGDAVTAILLGSLMIQGIIPGPQLFTQHSAMVYTIMVGLIFVNLAMYLEGRFLLRLFVKITKVPMNFMIPVILLLCITGAYAVNNTFFDVVVMLIFGIVGYVFTRFGFPVTPMLLAIILGPMAEEGMRQSLIMSGGSASIFFKRPICLLFLVISAASIAWHLVREYLPAKKGPEK